MSEYRGDTPGKKIARWHYWVHVAKEMGMPRFLASKHLCLASHEGGDIGALLALGVDPKNIVAVDREASIIEACRTKWSPRPVIFECMDVRDAAKKHRGTLGSALLDFCSNLTSEMIDTTLDVIHHGLRSESHLGCAVLMGREKEGYADRTANIVAQGTLDRKKLQEALERVKTVEDPSTRLFALEDALRSLSSPFSAAEAIETYGSARVAWQRVKEQFADDRVDTARARFMVLAHELHRRCLTRRRCIVIPTYCTAYQSASRESHGSPMLYWGGRVIRHESPQPPIVLSRKFFRALERAGDVKMQLLSRVTEERVRDVALSMVESGKTVEHVALCLNLRPQTVSAWKAHKTMGTYGVKTKT